MLSFLIKVGINGILAPSYSDHDGSRGGGTGFWNTPRGITLIIGIGLAFGTGQEKMHDQVFSFELKERTQIIVQTKNASRVYSGIYYPPMIGSAAGIARTISARIAIYAIICSIAICIVLLTLPFRRGKHAVRRWGFCGTYYLFYY